MGPEAVFLFRFLLTGVAILLAFLASATWNRRQEAPETTVFAVLLASMAVYSFGYAGELAQTSVAGASRWLDVEYLALPWAGALWLLAACRRHGIKVRASLLFVIPLITFVGHFTNFRNLFYAAPMTMVHRPPFWVLSVERGPLSTLDNAYLLVAFLAGSWLYLSGFRHASPLYRKQALIMLLGSVVPFAGYFLFYFGLSPWGLDITPIALSITCGMLYYGIFHCGVFDLAPLARALIFDTSRDSVLILDNRDRLLDFNPAASKLLPVLCRKNVGAEVATLLADRPNLANAICGAGNPAEFEVEADGESHFFEVRTWPLFSDSMAFGRGRLGRAVVLAEVTAQVHLREELRRYAETDALTGLANRRRFHQALETECMRFGRGEAPFSVLMIDLDFFKEVNDQFGHPAGDAVLVAVAKRLLVTLRKTDLLARYGGEEFSVLLPETPCEGAGVIAERLRLAIGEAPVEVDGVPIALTVSVGVASHAGEGEPDPLLLLKKADLALYRAKTAGRDRVEVA